MVFIKKQDRRDFIKHGLTGIAGAAVLSSIRQEAVQAGEKEKKIIYRSLGKTGLKLPIVSMGTGDTNNINLIKGALDEGISYLATSNYYGNGENEKLVGQAIKDRKRDSVLITTSVGPEGVNHKEGLFTEKTKAEPFIRKFEGSLKRLNVDYVDIFILPFAAKRQSVFFEPLLRAMEDIKKQGKARFIGIATHSYEPEAIRAAVEIKIYDVAITAYNFRRKNIPEIKNAVAEAAKAGLGIIAMKTMAGAYWDKERQNPINHKAALKWVLQDENVTTAIPGFTTFDQLHDDISIMSDLSLSESEKSDLKLTMSDMPDGIYCQQCGKCVPQCSGCLDIPTIMRSYMYAYGYNNFAHAQETLELAEINTNSCDSCDSCNVNCSMGFDIKSKIEDIVRLKNVPSEFLV